jgi:hypothetical protein
MTFVLLRAGLPNSMVAIALAVLPIVALALSPAQRAPHAPAQSVEAIVVAGSEPAASGDQSVLN